MSRTRSDELFATANRYLPGGVNSPVRSFKAVKGSPVFVQCASGSKLYDMDGNEFLDYVCSWGPLILGHSHPQVIEALNRAINSGTSFGAPTELEITLARMVCEAVPSIEMVRFVSSGTEATMSALRLARAFTNRDKIIKFEGCYHGHSDGLLAEAGSGVTTLSVPTSPGVPHGYTENTLLAPYNDIGVVQELISQHDDIAAVIVEPVAANMGVVLPQPGFLQGLRDLTEEQGALLVFDEVITGFRVSYGGAQELYGVIPDLTCLGKIVGGGLPVGAFGGRQDIMEMIAPSGPVYQAGTLAGNPLAMTAGIETLRLLAQSSAYYELEERSSRLEEGIRAAAVKHSLPVKISRLGSMMTVFFTSEEITDFKSACGANTSIFAEFFSRLLEQGIYWPPSQFEAVFISLAHSDMDIRKTIQAVDRALGDLSSINHA